MLIVQYVIAFLELANSDIAVGWLEQIQEPLKLTSKETGPENQTSVFRPKRFVGRKDGLIMAGSVHQIEHGIAAERSAKCPCRSGRDRPARVDCARAWIEPFYVQCS